MKKLTDFPAVVAAEATLKEVESRGVQVRAAIRENERRRLAIIAARSKSTGAVALLLDNNDASLAELEREWQSLEQREPLVEKALREARAMLTREIEQASALVCREEQPNIHPIIRENVALLDTLAQNNEKLRLWRESLQERGFSTSSAPICIVPNAAHLSDFYRKSIEQDFPHLKV